MALTPKREAFAQAVSKGMTQADALRASRNTERMKPETIQNEASKLMAIPEVITRVEELRKELADKGLWTREDSARTLISVINRKIKDDDGNEVQAAQDKDIIASVKELNSMHGYNAPIKTEANDKLTIVLNKP